MKKNDKGERGFGFGTLDAEARAFLKPDADTKLLYGKQLAVGMDWKGMNKIAANAQLEGDDV